MYFSVCVDAWICLSDGVAARVPPLPCRYAYNRWSPLCLCVSVFPAAYAYIVSTATYRDRDDDGTDGRHELQLQVSLSLSLCCCRPVGVVFIICSGTVSFTTTRSSVRSTSPHICALASPVLGDLHDSSCLSVVSAAVVMQVSGCGPAQPHVSPPRAESQPQSSSGQSCCPSGHGRSRLSHFSNPSRHTHLMIMAI